MNDLLRFLLSMIPIAILIPSGVYIAMSGGELSIILGVVVFFLGIFISGLIMYGGDAYKGVGKKWNW